MNNKNTTPAITWLQENSNKHIHFTAHAIAYIGTWNELLFSLSGESASRLKLLILDAAMFSTPGLTISEVISMLHTIVKCNHPTHNIDIAVAIDRRCHIKFIKELQQNKVLGIIPADDYFGDHQFNQSLDALSLGKAHWPMAVISELKQTPATKSKRGEIQLTTRQSQVLELVGNRGLSNKKIATILGISESTVKIHISAILKEFGVRNRTQLALAATSKLKA
ncbi:CitB Response regulator containing a CheY-like receiver domain and an HTH DNA-binding domain [uncultured Caudovirales phage]|uniref:CitB Response regulator containing a CheY-like receiver domain and an HTH DNA-binding domain n=1 Tax=uncultured Caudovirales phage TaxID=2100421 RepID=A0A6J5LEU8_9CAUD|nr:CitB Response regulator containing a CheY-like receiver domain and an HTH DNA-binding domain [uncultured Caudovirales phage]